MIDIEYAGECPFCNALVQTVSEEVAHMESAHPEIVEERLRSAGFHTELAEFRARRAIR